MYKIASHKSRCKITTFSGHGQIKKASQTWGGLVPHIRVELMIFCVRGRCPGPLDECGSSIEIGCKSTHFFHTDKIFFANILYRDDCQHNIFHHTFIQGMTNSVLPGSTARNSGAYMHCILSAPDINAPGLVTYTSYSMLYLPFSTCSILMYLDSSIIRSPST